MRLGLLTTQKTMIFRKMNVKVFVGALAMLSLAACSKNDVFDAEQVEKNKEAQAKAKMEESVKVFQTEFEKHYGKVDPNQSWDFSSGKQRLGTRAGEGITTKIVEGLDFDIKYDIDFDLDAFMVKKYKLTNRTVNKNKALYTKLAELLPDKKTHNGKPVTLVAPASSFTIYPLICSSGWTHDLFVKVGDNTPVKVYSKTWTDYSHFYSNGDPLKTTISSDRKSYTVDEKVSMPGIYIEAPVGTPIEVYLDNVKNGDTAMPAVGTTNGYAIYVEAGNVKPEGIKLAEGAAVNYIGIEDNTTSSSDKDYNDVVLAVVGNPDVPKEVIIENEKYDVPSVLEKRYMVEDLGEFDDFDFNDVVVDVVETTVTHHKVTSENGLKKSDVVTGTTKTQKAIIRHLGGTLPFVLKIGGTTLPKMGSLSTWKTDPNQEFVVEGWIPNQNNVSFTMNDVTIPFPKVGGIPIIFACDTNVKWAEEREVFDLKKHFGVVFR